MPDQFLKIRPYSLIRSWTLTYRCTRHGHIYSTRFPVSRAELTFSFDFPNTYTNLTNIVRHCIANVKCMRGAIMSTSENVLHITLEFRGGAELLFNNVKKHNAELPLTDKPWTIRSLLVWIKENLLKERPELFVQGDSVRPGILVLVNESDWELLGGNDYVLTAGDTVLFISTLHGG